MNKHLGIDVLVTIASLYWLYMHAVLAVMPTSAVRMFCAS